MVLFCSFPLNTPTNTISNIQYITSPKIIFVQRCRFGQFFFSFKSHVLHLYKKSQIVLAAQAWQLEQCYEYWPEWLCFTSCFSLGSSVTLPKRYVAQSRIVIMIKVVEEKKKKVHQPFCWLFIAFVFFLFCFLLGTCRMQRLENTDKNQQRLFQLWLCYLKQESVPDSWQKTRERPSQNVKARKRNLNPWKSRYRKQATPGSCILFLLLLCFAHLRTKT